MLNRRCAQDDSKSRVSRCACPALLVTFMVTAQAHGQPAPVVNAFGEAQSTSAIGAAFELPQTVPEAMPTPVTLMELEQLALENNPTLGVAWANINAARGRQVQGGLSPNPTVGYFGMDIGEMDTAGQHGGFINQEFVTGGKLRLNRAVAGQEVREQQHRRSAQELRVLSDVRLRFYDALVAQRQVELTSELARVSERLSDSSRQLLEALQVSESDLLQAEIEAEEAEILAANSTNQNSEAWRRLAAVVGLPADDPRPLSGTLDGDLPTYEWTEAYSRVLAQNPELAAADARVRRARLSIGRARRENVPNVEVEASVSYMDQSDETVAGVQVGIPIPVLNRNQGNIMAAQAELVAAENNIRRIELELQDRLAMAYRRYANARQQVERYQQQILPRAQRSLDLVGQGYREGQSDFLSLLTSQRTYIRTNLAYVAALAELRQSAALIDGQLLSGSFEAE